MEAFVRPLERIVEAGEWFVRTPELRVLHVVASNAMRIPALKHLTATELLEANKTPFFVLEGPVETDDDGWALRTEELRADWQALQESAPDPSALPPLWPEERKQRPLSRFSLELGRAQSQLRPPMTGLVVVLAPVWVRDAARWSADLDLLLHLEGLRNVRFVVIEMDQPAALPIIQKLGPLAEHLDARVSDADVREEMSARLAAMKAAPAGAPPRQMMGAAGPRVAPPRRKKQPPPLSPERRAAVGKELGVSPTALDPDAMKNLRVLVLSAAAAIGDGSAPEGIRLQREARDFCVKEGLVREAVVNELVLAGYVLQAGKPERALEIFRDGRVRAEKAGLIDMAVQAQIAVGSCLLVGKRVDDAAAAYGEAGQLGAAGNAPIMAVEAFRLCGQLLASKGRLQQATQAFMRAIETAERGGDEVKQSSSVVEAARQLAALCRKHGLHQQAQSLEAQARAIEDAQQEPAVPASGDGAQV
jgi:hypothetical protein